jgi:Ca-activated chloride channel family protein
MKMKKYKLLFAVLSFGLMSAQNNIEKKSNNLVFDGNIEFEKKDLELAEYKFRKAKAIDSFNYNAPYNLGNSLYKNKLSVDAELMYKKALRIDVSKENKHKGFHNLGNTYMQKEDYQNAVNAFRSALLNNPDDEETRYNYVLAKELLKKQNQNKDNNKDQKDQKDKNQDQKENEGENDKKDKDQKNKDGDKNPQETKKNQISPQQLKNLLEAMNKEEKKVQDKVNKKKFKGNPKSNKKDW